MLRSYGKDEVSDSVWANAFFVVGPFGIKRTHYLGERLLGKYFFHTLY